MKKGAYVLIFFFWASLTIITPTLVQWSAEAAAAAAAASKSKEDETGKGIVSSSEGTSRARKMMELFQEIQLRKAPPQPSLELVAELASPPPPLPPSPAPAPGDDEMIKEPKVEVRESSKKVVSTSRKFLQIKGE